MKNMRIMSRALLMGSLTLGAYVFAGEGSESDHDNDGHSNNTSSERALHTSGDNTYQRDNQHDNKPASPRTTSAQNNSQRSSEQQDRTSKATFYDRYLKIASLNSDLSKNDVIAAVAFAGAPWLVPSNHKSQLPLSQLALSAWLTGTFFAYKAQQRIKKPEHRNATTALLLGSSLVALGLWDSEKFSPEVRRNVGLAGVVGLAGSVVTVEPTHLLPDTLDRAALGATSFTAGLVAIAIGAASAKNGTYDAKTNGKLLVGGLTGVSFGARFAHSAWESSKSQSLPKNK